MEMVVMARQLKTLVKDTKQKIVSVHKPKPRFEISSVIDEFQGMNENLIVNDGYSNIDGTSNPYQFNLFSDLITNPSSVSISEFQKMVYTQPIIATGLTVLINLVINEIGPYHHKNKKHEEFIQNMIDNFTRPFHDILKDMLTAIWAGFSMGEKRYGSDGRYVTVLDIEPRPASSIIFRVDSQGHLKDDGIIQYYFNNLWTGYGNLLAFNQVGADGKQQPNPYASRGDFDYPWRTVWAQPIGTIMIPKNKCVHFVYKGLDGLTSPYGRSLLRAIYNYYLAQTQMLGTTLNAANSAAQPIPVIVIDPNQTTLADGTNVLDDIGNQLEQMKSPGGANYLLMAGKKESIIIDKLNTAIDLDKFVNVSNYYDKLMLTGVLFPGELAGLSDKGSYALGKTQQDLLGRNVASIVDSLKSCLIQQLVKPLLELNFNEKDDFGSFGENENVAEDISLNLDKINALRYEGIKLKPEAIMGMMDISMDSVESFNNPIIDTNPPETNNGVNANFSRAMNSQGR
jgi:hypothetical protein